MEIYYSLMLICLVSTCAVTAAAWQSGTSVTRTPAFKSFQMLYLVVYMLAFFGDWLQGPYVYALYDEYGFDQGDIAVLFVAGFGSSMVFGSIVGSLADKMGRKKFALLYCFFYIASCMTKHFPNYWMLMLGRVLGGIATSLLFSAFETWMVSEHNVRGYDPSLLSDTFSKAMFGNSLVAILSGFVANFVANLKPLTPTQTEGIYYGGNCSPFDASMVVLGICAIVVQLFWNENYGAGGAVAEQSGLSLSSLSEAVSTIRNDSKIFMIGAIAAIFEGSMYTFVFLWTPLLQAADRKDLPFGMIFAVLMLSCMGGSQIFSLLVTKYSVGKITQYMMVVASASLFVPVFVTSPTLLMVSFSVFEVCVGIYWPCICTLKGTHVPESQRAAIYNVFRIPLNAIVLFVLLSKIKSQQSFVCCAVLLAVSCYLVGQLNNLIAVASIKKPVDTQELLPQAPDDDHV